VTTFPLPSKITPDPSPASVATARPAAVLP
jgi:hypothetical protein